MTSHKERKLQNLTAEKKTQIEATIRAVLEAPALEPVEFEMAESAPAGTKGRILSVVLPDGFVHRSATKDGTCRMYAKYRDPISVFGASQVSGGEEIWTPVSRAFRTVEALHNSNWYRSASKWANMDDFSEFRVARIH